MRFGRSLPGPAEVGGQWPSLHHRRDLPSLRATLADREPITCAVGDLTRPSRLRRTGVPLRRGLRDPSRHPDRRSSLRPHGQRGLPEADHRLPGPGRETPRRRRTECLGPVTGPPGNERGSATGPQQRRHKHGSVGCARKTGAGGTGLRMRGRPRETEGGAGRKLKSLRGLRLSLRGPVLLVRQHLPERPGGPVRLAGHRWLRDCGGHRRRPGGRAQPGLRRARPARPGAAHHGRCPGEHRLLRRTGVHHAVRERRTDLPRAAVPGLRAVPGHHFDHGAGAPGPGGEPGVRGSPRLSPPH